MTSHYLVVDLEATCCDQRSIPRSQTEIIEIGAVMVKTGSWKALDEFQAFVKPKLHPRLTDFCLELTGITQAQVDGGRPFSEVLQALVEWAEGFPDYLFCSWGNYDKHQFDQDCTQHGLAMPFANHCNLKGAFAAQRGLRRGVGMKGALGMCGLELKGQHHRGIDDARNIARLVPYALGLTDPCAGSAAGP
ncbi:MAG: exonuclease domain-containing protein [Vulcanimicrobiota bacterium]